MNQVNQAETASRRSRGRPLETGQQDLREKILDTAEQMFTESGYAARIHPPMHLFQVIFQIQWDKRGVAPGRAARLMIAPEYLCMNALAWGK